MRNMQCDALLTIVIRQLYIVILYTEFQLLSFVRFSFIELLYLLYVSYYLVS